MNAPIITPLSYSFKLLELPADCSIELAGLRWTAKSYNVKVEIKTTTSIYTSLSITIDWQTVSIQLAIDTTLGELLDALLRDQEALMLLHAELAEGSALTDSAIALENSALVYCSQCSGVIVSGVVPTQVTTDIIPATNTLVAGTAPDGVIEFETLDGKANTLIIAVPGANSPLMLLAYTSSFRYIVLLGTDAEGASISTVAEVVAAIAADSEWASKVTAREISAGVLTALIEGGVAIGSPAVPGSVLTFTPHVPDASVRIISATGTNPAIIVSTAGSGTLIELASDNANNTGTKLAKAVSNGSALCSVTPAVASATVTPLESTSIGSPYSLCLAATNPDISINFSFSYELFLECVGNNINITLISGGTTVSQLIELVDNSICAQTSGLSVESVGNTSSSALLTSPPWPIRPNHIAIYRNDLIERYYSQYGDVETTPAWSRPFPAGAGGTRRWITDPISIQEYNLVEGDDFYLRVQASMAWNSTSSGSIYTYRRKSGLISFVLPAGKSANFNCVGMPSNVINLGQWLYYQLVIALYPKALWDSGFPANLMTPDGRVRYEQDPLDPESNIFKSLMEETTPFLKQFVPHSGLSPAATQEEIDAAPGVGVSVSAEGDSVVALQFMAVKDENLIPYSTEYLIDWVIRRLVIS